MLYTFGSNIKVPEDLILVKEKEIMEYMRYSEKAEMIMEDIRKCKNKEEKRILKEKLPYITASRFSNKRRVDDFIESQMFILDIDNIDFIDYHKSKLSKIPLIRFIFSSPSGNGLRVGILLEKTFYEPKLYSRAYRVFTDIFEKKTGLKCDKTCSVASPFFISYDPNLYYNPKSVPWKVVLPEESLPPVYNSDDIEIQSLIDMARKTTINNHYDWVRAGISLRTLGEEGYQVFRALSLGKGKGDGEEKLRSFWEGFPEDPYMSIGTFIYLCTGNE